MGDGGGKHGKREWQERMGQGPGQSYATGWEIIGCSSCPFSASIDLSGPTESYANQSACAGLSRPNREAETYPKEILGLSPTEKQGTLLRCCCINIRRIWKGLDYRNLEICFCSRSWDSLSLKIHILSQWVPILLLFYSLLWDVLQSSFSIVLLVITIPAPIYKPIYQGKLPGSHFRGLL